ncbi:MAG: MotA/TolQ/ExbB proton channel family protein [Thermoguttaceae bacterium]|nr:MotA/TolQ/ExbB proton channel family protein [Thermoguttaceae bacterium]
MKRFLTLSFISLFLTLPAFAQDDAIPVPEDVTEEQPFVPVVDSDPAPAPQSDAAPAIPETEANAPDGGALPASDPSQMALKDLEEGDKEVAQKEEEARLTKEKEQAELEAKKNQVPKIEILKLIQSGGELMWIIGALSVLGLMFALERFIALRRGAIMPRRLFKQMTPYLEPSKFSPMAIWAICEKYRSPAGRIIQAALLKIGRPLPEIVAAVESAKQDEATNMYRNVRWLTLVSSLAPLLGLLGTVWGMIQAFYITANLEIGANRAEQLSSGIYVALVTTAAGLAVAIPAAFIAHMFEGRILKAFHKLDSKLLPLYDILEKQEGKPRITLAQYQAKK